MVDKMIFKMIPRTAIARTVCFSVGSVIILFLIILLLTSWSPPSINVQRRFEYQEDGHLFKADQDSSERIRNSQQKGSSEGYSGAASTEQTANGYKSTEQTETTSSSFEYVVPEKLSPNSFHQEDIFYGSDAPQEITNEDIEDSDITLKHYHHSGHFRPNTAEIWDPHPEYRFSAFGRTFHLILKHDSDFVLPNLKVTHISRNFSRKFSLNVKPNGCYYTGHLKDQMQSIVAVSLCNGMTGYINTGNEGYLIEPAEKPSTVVDTFQHKISRTIVAGTDDATSHDPNRNSNHCGTQEDINDSNSAEGYPESLDDSLETTSAEDYYNASSTMDAESHNRKKRSLSATSEYIVELMVVADSKMAEYHGTSLHNYVLTLMSIVSKIYKDKTIGNPMHIAVVKFVVLNETSLMRHRPGAEDRGMSASELLDDFCRWQMTMYDVNNIQNTRHDSALLLTREDICRSQVQHKCNNTLGLAHLGTMCQKNSCSIVRDNGLSAAFTIAHELGHILSMPHDDETRCNKYREKGARPRVMSRVLNQHTHPWTWSSCSRHYLTEYLDVGNGECLKDSPYRDLLKDETNDEVLPGENYTSDRQCELIYGPDWRICSEMEICFSLWCTRGFIKQDGCRTHHMPWAEGTPCKPNHWCQQGECVQIDRNALLPVDGGWGAWQAYGECSRTCGGGIRKAYRECDNPPPQNGGKYCLGERVRYQSCGIKECRSSTSSDFRADQCAKFNNNTFNIHNLTSSVQWVPKYGGRDNDRCKLYCQVLHSNAYYQLQDKVIDGTPCGPDTFDICVNGICQSAGCDHILDSGSKLDMCGVCGGNNTSCKQVYNVHNTSQYGYNHVITVPAGSANIDIRQHGYQNSFKDNNYLALLDPESGEYLLNGNFVVTMFRKVFRYGGTKIEYSGAKSVVERINSSLPLNRELVIELLSIGNLNPPDVVYQYTIPRSPAEYFKWEVTDEWTQCNKVCHGEQERIVRCVRKDNMQYVSVESCMELIKPKTQTRPCNDHCGLRWKMVSQSECSSQCGEGTRLLTYQCIQEFTHQYNSRPLSLLDNSCDHITKPPEVQICIGSCDEARWKYSDWQPCSVSCGSGIQSRTAECVDELGRPMDEYKCTSSEKITQRVCNNGKCPEWYTGKWSTCSGVCGTGERNRQIWCRKDNRVVSTSLCVNSKKPREKESCQLEPCPQWLTGEWSPCSVNCGIGTVTRSVRCSVAEDGACPQDQKPASKETCNQPACSNENEIPDTFNSVNSKSSFSWQVGEWEPCSKSCGQGFRTRSIRCYNTVTRNAVDKRHCSNENLPQTVDTCYGPPCTTWKTSNWSPCSTTCGQGVSRRSLKCVSLATLEEVSPAKCDSIEKPETEVSCNTNHFCKTTTTTTAPVHNWRIGRWGECSASCGGGMKVRAVECQNEAGEPSFNCNDSKPESSAPCNHHPCPSTYTWKYGEWSQCNQTCNEGYQHRQAQCVDQFGDNMPEHYCNENPYLLQRCKNTPCPTHRYEWKTSAWSECSVTCGDGVKQRLVECKRINIADSSEEVVVRDEYCPEDRRPDQHLKCQLKECPEEQPYFWVPGPWGECNYPCEKKGRQKRNIYCFNRNGNKVHRRYCNSLPNMPARKKKCNRKKCGFVSCSDVLKKTGKSVDKEYMLTIFGRNISIYCYKMLSQSPIEFLTLPAGESENYAEFYEKRLMDPDSCPFDGDRRTDCPCMNDKIPDAGITLFSRVRLNISSLEVITTDFTFSRQLRGKPVPYGEAGDCYSRVKCPQGRFSVDLSGTGFRISPSTVWSEYKRRQYTSLWINKLNDNRKVVGKCGGYCGRCRPNQGLKLDVLPP